MKARLTRSRKDRIIFGVCGGLAEYFGVDAVIIRLAFVVFTIIEWPGILLYIILAIIIPGAEKENMTEKQTIDKTVENLGEQLRISGEKLEEKVDEFGKELVTERPKRAMWLGTILILLGLFFLIDRLGFLWWLREDLFLPLVLILLGAWLLISYIRGGND
jgi:phage shock protein C